MKKLLCAVMAIAMFAGTCPVLGFGATNSVNAVRTAYFNNAGEWKETDGDNILVSVGGPNETWTAPNSFTDLDGSVTNQEGLGGTGFLTARHALVAFEIPEGFNTENDMKVTLALTVKNVKQVTSGARLAVYGNSIEGSWSLGTGTAAFGLSGNVSGVENLELLGLTDAVKTGNQTGESPSGEVITLSSLALTDYVKRMANMGYKEVTFRLTAPLGGIRIYDYKTSTPPSLTIEEGTLSGVNVNTVFYDGDEVVDTETVTVSNVFAGSVYTYGETPRDTIVKGSDIYVYSPEKSTLSVSVAEDGTSEIVIAYIKNTDTNIFSGYLMDDEAAWCWFADPRSITYKNEEGTIDVTVIGNIDVHGNIKATQINNITNKVDEVLIRSNIQPDDHNNPTFLVLPDERIIVFYSRHTDEACFWYRVTREKGDITTFGEEKCLKTSANTTYPSPFILKNDPENIYLCWRGIGWHPTIAKISLPDENGDMHFTYGPYQMVQSTGARPYAKYASNGVDKIYVSYTTGHPDNEDPNWLYFNQIDIATMTLQDINGNTMSTIANGVLNVNKSNNAQSHIVDSTGGVRNWLWQVAVAEDGYPVIANVRINGGKTSHDYYYVKWNGSEWVKTFVTNGGGKFHTSNTEYCYSGGMAIDPENTNVMYCSKPVDGIFGKVFEIFKYTMSEDGTTVIESEQITQNSVKNNVRPFIIPGSSDENIKLQWMNGDYAYWMVNRNYPAGYPTAGMIDKPLPKCDINIENAVVNEDYEKIGGAFVSTDMTANVIEAKSDGEFTVSADVYLGEGYKGKILDLGNVSLSIENILTQYADDASAMRAKPVLTVNGERFESANVYGNSDDWKLYSNGTNGDYYFTKYTGYVNLTVAYDGEYIYLYRDGSLDIKEKACGISIDDIAVGGFNGYVENVAVYDRVLNFDEIKLLSSGEYIVKDPGVEGDRSITIRCVNTSGENICVDKIIKIAPGSDKYNYIPEKSLYINGVVYTYDSMKQEDNVITVVYEKNKKVGGNMVPDGAFENGEGKFSWGTWQSPSTGEYFNSRCDDWFYVVNRDTNAAVLYGNSMEAQDYALGTRWNDGTAGLCSMANFIEVEAGKTYIVSYDYKNKTNDASGATIRTTFQKTKDFVPDDSADNNIPVNVTTDWQTNTFAITAPEDGYIYFHFYWLGSGSNSNTGSNTGDGPYWYFDNFEVYEMEPEAITAVIESKSENEVVVEIKNVSAQKAEIKVYAASYNESEAEKIESKAVTVEGNSEEKLVFNISGDVKVFIWDENMRPLHDPID